MHPRVRRWYERHPGVVGGRARFDDPEVRALVERVAPGATVVDLGGEDGLNLRLVEPGSSEPGSSEPGSSEPGSSLPGPGDSGLVLRVHKPFVSERRLRAGHRVRERLAGRGLRVPRAVGVERCGRRWAELEEYVPLGNVAASSFEAYAWHLEALGTLHGALGELEQPVPGLVNGCFVSHRTLRGYLAATRDERSAGEQVELRALVRRLAERWVPPADLARQLVHSDAHRGNVVPAGGPGADTAVYLDLGLERAPRAYDLARALVYLAVESGGATDPEGVPWEWMPGLLERYADRTAQPLGDLERRALPAYMIAIALFTQICDWSDDPWRPLAAWLLENPDALG